MVGRPVDHRRRAGLLEAAVDHAAEQGFSELSFRSVASALGVSTTTLVHHFGTKEQLLEAVLERLRVRVAAATEAVVGESRDLVPVARAVWAASSDPRHEATFRLFFAVYGHALQTPERFQDFLYAAGRDLSDLLRRAQAPDVDPVVAERRAALVIATVRGLLLDLLAHGDRERVQATAESFFATLAASPLN